MFYLVRHGEPDYSNVGTKIYQGIGGNFSSLTKQGINQIKNTGKDTRLKDSQIIISSPFTRALQSAAILSKELQLDIVVEHDLHEWLSNKNYDNLDKKDDVSYQEYCNNNGKYPPGEERQWEDDDILKARIIGVLNKYKEYKKVIVVCHGMLIHSIYPNRWLDCGEVVEYNLE